MLIYARVVSFSFYKRISFMSTDVETQVVLGNATELALRISQGLLTSILPNEVAGTELNESVLISLIESRIQYNLSKYL